MCDKMLYGNSTLDFETFFTCNLLLLVFLILTSSAAAGNSATEETEFFKPYSKDKHVGNILVRVNTLET